MAATIYTPSQRIGPSAVPLTVLAAAVSLACAWAYAWLALVSPQIVVWIGWLMSALGLHLMARLVCRWGKVRNPVRMGWVGGALGLLFWYSHWAALAALTLHRAAPDGPALAAGFFHVAVHPTALPAVILDARSALAEGIAIYFMVLAWVIECWLLIMAPRGAGSDAADAVFCEQSGTWAVEIRLEDDFEGIADEEAFRRQLEAQPQQLASMLVRRPEGGAPADHVSVTLFACAQDDCYLTVDHHLQDRSSPDADVYFVNPIVERLRIPGMSAQELLRSCGLALPEKLLELRSAHPSASCRAVRS